MLQDGETALYQAAHNNQEQCVLALLEGGCDPNIITAVQGTTLTQDIKSVLPCPAINANAL